MKTLIVEDSATLCAIYQAYMDGTGLEVFTVGTYGEAVEALVKLKPELILLDIELPDGNGLDLLDITTKMTPKPSVVVMTGHGKEYADTAMARGANDFLSKPFDAPRLRVTLMNAAENVTLAKQLREFKRDRDHMGEMYGSSPVMQAVYSTIDSLATSKATAFITGESGTGKELASKAIHSLSERAPQPFVVVNCAAIPSEVIETELFGEVEGSRGAGSPGRLGLVRQADGGSLFLDEVCELPYEVQGVLLRLIQHGSFKPVGSDNDIQVDVRIIAATNRDPLVELREGRLREDLYYRLHVVPLRMPPLRERSNDVVELANRFLNIYSEREHKAINKFSSDAVRELKRYPWPGNVRQLENTIYRLVVTTEADEVSYDALRAVISDANITTSVAPSGGIRYGAQEASRTEIEPLWLVEKRAIQSALDACDGNINKAAGLLEVAPSTIYRKIQSWKTGGE